MAANRAVWMKGICQIWSRGRHFSPSLPARRPTQGRGPTGIWHSAHSISDAWAEISGILVTGRFSSAMSRGITYWFRIFSCTHAQFFHCQEKWRNKGNEGNNELDPRVYATFNRAAGWRPTIPWTRIWAYVKLEKIKLHLKKDIFVLFLCCSPMVPSEKSTA